MRITDKYLDLLPCNLEGIPSFDLDMLGEEFEIYNSGIQDWSVYGPTKSLDNWKNPPFEYPNIHPIHKKLVDTVSDLHVNTVCDIGAGAGVMAKYVYNSNRDIDLTCVEGSDIHISQMKENFDEENRVILPQIKVNANVIRGVAQEIPLPTNSQDLVYTCTVLMHIPYLMAIKAIEEISRVSHRYVLHLERKDGNVIMGKQKSALNLLQIDYQSVYSKLGFRTIKYEEFSYPEHEHLSCVYYLGEK
jgi:phospholipid N-methyltransferase